MEADAQLEGQDVEAGGEEEQPKYKGFQARIDELTKEKHEAKAQAERERAMREAREAELLGMITQMRPAPQTATAPIPELDPEVARAIDARFASKYEAKLAALEEKLARAEGVSHHAAFEAAIAGVPEAVAARAKELLPAVLKRGLPPADAVTFAFGELVRRDPASVLPQQPRTQGGQFAPGASILTQTHAPPPPVQAAATKPLPANFNSLPIAQRIKILEQRGAADKPI